MKVFLIGYQKSKKILRPSSFLVQQYLPPEFDVNYVNFGSFKESALSGHSYIKLANYRKGGSDSWSSYIKNLLKDYNDEYIIFSLDDYLLSKEINIENFNILYQELKNNENIVSANLSISPEEKYKLDDVSSIYTYKDDYSFTVNTQWRIWRKEFLIELLSKTTNPWKFEIDGSKYLNSSKYKAISYSKSILDYPEMSSMSARNPKKISVLGNQKEDIEKLIELGYLKRKDLIMGQFANNTPKYDLYKDNQFGVLEYIKNHEEKHYYEIMLDKCLN